MKSLPGFRLFCVLLVSGAFASVLHGGEKGFDNVFVSPSPNAATIAWSCGDREGGAKSYVEYGVTDSYGSKTEQTADLRLNQIHFISGIEPGKEYHYRMVNITSAGQVASADATFTTSTGEGFTQLKSTGSRQELSQSGGKYVLAEDIVSSGSAILITAENVILDLNGHAVKYSDGDKGRFHGIEVKASGVKIKNGKIIQSEKATSATAHPKLGSYGLASFYKALDAEFSGLSIFVHQKQTNAVCFLGKADNVKFHHNFCDSKVNIIASRHYPGCDIARFDVTSGNTVVANNVFINGSHRGVYFHGKSGNIEVAENDIAHTQGYVNGYAIGCHNNMKIHGNRITSIGRGIHVTASNIEIYDNYLNLKQHMVFDDRGGKWRHYYTENHGIKLENCNTGVKVHGNKIVSTQLLPDKSVAPRFRKAVEKARLTIEDRSPGMLNDCDHFAPATPLNFHTKFADAMIEVYENEFVAITKFNKASNGRGYNNPGEWAAGIRIVDGQGNSSPGKYSLYVHDNVFKSNDCFVRAENFSQNIRIEKNKFVLLPEATSNKAVARGSGAAKVMEILKSGGNTFEGMKP